MAKNFNTINGKNRYIKYPEFEQGIKNGMPYCSNAEIFLFNNFPVDVSTEIGVDFMLVIAVQDVSRNYQQITKGQRKVYLHNLIMPVKVVPNLDNAEILLKDGVIYANDAVIDYSEELTSLKFGMRDYLANKCSFSKDSLFVHPLVFVVNKTLAASQGHLAAETFSFEAMLYYLQNCTDDIFISYAPWRTSLGFGLISQDIKRVVDQASRDSKTGFITQKKIDRITKEISVAHDIFKEVGERMVIIEGKAGTGKTSEMLLIMMYCVDHGNNTLFLTFNKLLVYDISKTIRSYNSKSAHLENYIKAEHSVNNIHRFMHQLSRSIGLLHLMSESRIQQVGSLLDHRVKKVGRFIKDFLLKLGITIIDYKIISPLKTAFQNSSFERGEIEVGIDVANYINRTRAFEVGGIDSILDKFVTYKKELLSKLEGDKIFLADYYNVLEDTLFAIRDPSGYFVKYKIESKYDLLETVMKLSEKHLVADEISIKIDQKKFLTSVKARFSGRKRMRRLFVDEAQDCHPLEREILLSIFGFKNVVVSSGGYEQLIRHVELCNWNFFNKRKLIGSPTHKRFKQKLSVEDDSQFSIFSPEDIPTSIVTDEGDPALDQVIWYKKGRKSFRVKKSILDFCNFVAESCNIPLGLQAINSEDEGEIIFDLRINTSSAEVKIEMDKLLTSADINGCTPYEGLIMLIDAEAKFDKGGGGRQSSATINEYGNIEDSMSKPKKIWQHADALNEDSMLWDGAVEDKNELGIPAPSESRLIYYESCRGLEAWSVACFNLDRFFSSKLGHPDAEKYLIEEEREKAIQGMGINNDIRKMMFAGTWTLMALTRAMDKVYISINDEKSAFGKIVMDYIKTNPKNVRILI